MSDEGRISPHNIKMKIKQTGDKNKEKYQVGYYLLIQYQVLQIKIIRTVL